MANDMERLRAARQRLGGFARAAPAVMQGFGMLSKAATAPGAFSAAQRELIAIAISVATGCDDCILYHVEAAKRHGAHQDALVEALEVAVEMGGGPAVMYAARALSAWQAL